ncbi:hypothetical protein Tco_0848819 [Tanacetum coccineum]
MEYPSEDPYEETARQLLEQAPRSPEYGSTEREVMTALVVVILRGIRGTDYSVRDSGASPRVALVLSGRGYDSAVEAEFMLYSGFGGWETRDETLEDTVKGTNVIGYNQHFQELALLCVRMFPEESGNIERYVGGLPDMIHGNIVASKPKTMQEAVEMATELMDKKV